MHAICGLKSPKSLLIVPKQKTLVRHMMLFKYLADRRGPAREKFQQIILQSGDWIWIEKAVLYWSVRESHQRNTAMMHGTTAIHDILHELQSL